MTDSRWIILWLQVESIWRDARNGASWPTFWIQREMLADQREIGKRSLREKENVQRIKKSPLVEFASTLSIPFKCQIEAQRRKDQTPPFNYRRVSIHHIMKLLLK